MRAGRDGTDAAWGDRPESDYYGDEYLQDVLEQALLELGGSALLESAHAEAAAYVDRRFPWDGRGVEPPERVDAYLAVLWQRAKQEKAVRQQPR